MSFPVTRKWFNIKMVNFVWDFGNILMRGFIMTSLWNLFSLFVLFLQLPYFADIKVHFYEAFGVLSLSLSSLLFFWSKSRLENRE